MRSIELVGGTVTGASHRAAGRNNQDAFAWARAEHGVVAAVCDGCGSGRHSEVGAQLGARLFTQLAARLCGKGLSPEELLDSARRLLLAQLGAVAAGLVGDPIATTSLGEAVADHFLFTIVGALVDGEMVTPFSLGDGLVLHGEDRLLLGPFPDNAPPYLGYALLSSEDTTHCFRLRLHPSRPLAELELLLLGTDGIFDLEAAAGQCVPGRAAPIEPLTRLARDERVFANPDQLRRHLTIVGRQGLLPDDTTLVLLRRAPAGKR